MRTLIGLALLTTTASAAPMTYQGRLIDHTGVPIQGSTTVVASLSPTDGGSAVWTRSFGTVPVEDGYFSLLLTTDNDGDPIDAVDFASGSMFLTVQAGTVTHGPVELAATAFAQHAYSTSVPSVDISATCTDGTLAAADGTGQLLLCQSGAYQLIGAGSGSGVQDPRHPLVQFTPVDTQAVTDSDWVCNHPTPWSTAQGFGHMHLHNFSGAQCTLFLEDLLVGQEYAVSFRRYGRRVGLEVSDALASGTPTATLFDNVWNSHNGNNGGEHIATQAFVTVPSSGRLRLRFYQPDVLDAGMSFIDIQQASPPTLPHVVLQNQTFDTIFDVWDKGWDTNHSTAFSTANGGSIHLHNFAPATAIRDVEVVPGASYTFEYSRTGGPSRLVISALDRTNLSATTSLADETLSGTVTGQTVTFTAPASGLIRIVFSNPSTTDIDLYGFGLSSN